MGDEPYSGSNTLPANGNMLLENYIPYLSNLLIINIQEYISPCLLLVWILQQYGCQWFHS